MNDEDRSAPHSRSRWEPSTTPATGGAAAAPEPSRDATAEMPAQGHELPPAVLGTEDRTHRGRRRAAVAGSAVAGGAVALFAIGGLGGFAISQAAEGATTDTGVVQGADPDDADGGGLPDGPRGGGRGFPLGVGGGTTDDGDPPT